MSTMQSARLCSTDADYRRLGIEKGNPRYEEDDVRTSCGKGTFEWWYTDATFEDGTTVVCIFFSKNYFDVAGPAWPTVDIEVTAKDGTCVNRFVRGPKGFALPKQNGPCNISFENCSIAFKDGTYHVVYDDGTLRYDATMRPTMRPWRPDCGVWQFGEEAEARHFCWFVAAPEAEVEATLTLDGTTRTLRGRGYHDHNWGDTSMEKLMNHWYWGRAKVGDYIVIACDIVAEKRYGHKRLPVFMIAKDGVVLNDNASTVEVQRDETYLNEWSGKFMDDVLVYTQRVNANEAYTITFTRTRDILHRSLLEVVSPFKRVLASAVGMNPTYIRVLGDVKVDVVRNGQREVLERSGLWEQYFMGSNKEATIEGRVIPAAKRPTP